jgi:hypothetical protein
MFFFFKCQQDLFKIISIKDFVQEEKIRNRKKKEQQKLFINEIVHLLNLNAGWLTWEQGGRAGRPMQGMGTPT